MVKALGYEPKLPEPTTSNGTTSGMATTAAYVSKFLSNYPFPDTYTALEWPCFQDITAKDISLENVKVLFDTHREQVKKHTETWRRKIECGLTHRVLLDEGLPPLSDMVEVNGSTESTVSLSPLTQLLLRADIIFTTNKDAAYDEKLYHYPLFIPTKDTFWSYGWPQTIGVSQWGHSE
ncbi:hypothetical protein RSOLAG22IIIB_14001 [Rhizoctonia solani]|uniref:Uncharacterized protein n=1 Tax=Rhizoctonia solani TaxID=456999 RepID=A0A0K6FSY3_9AGAM|nr:hypothetical protein RSOLAG22IIIB_14001 [Rhizoctonia solani]